MGEGWRIFKLLMYKNFLVRKKHWRLALFVEIAIPVLLFLLGEGVRLLSGSGPIKIDNNSTYAIEFLDNRQVSMNNFKLRYTPKNNLTERILESMPTCVGVTSQSIVGSSNEESMLAEFAHDQSLDPYREYFGIVFENVENSRLTNNFKYNVRHSRRLPTDLYESEENGNSAHAFRFTPLINIQMCLDRGYTRQVLIDKKISLVHLEKVNMSIQQMPYPPYIEVDTATKVAGAAFGELARFAFLVILCVEVTFPTNEKYIGINILMSVNGVKNIQNLFGWLVSGVLFSIFYLAPIVIILKYFLPPTVIPFLEFGNSFIIWIVLTLHACHVIAFGMHITAYLWKPSHSIFAAFMITILMDILNKFAKGNGISRFFVYLGIFSPNFLLSRIFDQINAYEARLIGVGWNNLFSVGDAMASGENCLGVLAIFSILGTVVNFFMAVYVYAVRPGKYGVAQNPLFCLQKSNKVFHDIDASRMDYKDEKEFESVPDDTLTAGIQIRELKKAYVTDWFRNTSVRALNGISVDFYKGQITALLGHNGAGKTTMMSILAGLTSSTEGMVLIDGKNVRYELEAVRRNLGLCPQENMVFPDLTVFEQILFFGMLKAKGKTRRELEDQVKILLEKVNLTEKKNFVAKKLSGGQKRRMCLAMAVIGDASVIVLDEPTSGMDAESKREVWDIILKLRGEKTILISTHDMEEADILGDRIAIIHSGRMRCYGTSMFLKKLYGDGQVEVTLSIEPWCNLGKVIDEIGLNSQILNQDEGQAVLAIPLADNLPRALDALEKQKKKLGITGLSVSIITLEQVFLRVTREEGDETDRSNEAAKTFYKIEGANYFAQTFFAYIVKKLAFTRKTPWTFFISMILPCLSVILLILENSGNSSTSAPVVLTLGAYSYSRSMSYANDPIYNEKYITSAMSFGGTATAIGTDSPYCLNDALLAEALRDLSTYRNKFIVSAEFNTSADAIHANGFYSGTALLGIPATINMLSNTLLKSFTNDDTYSISLTAQALPESFAMPQVTADSFTLTMALLVFLAPAVALYVTQPLQENLSGIKQLQSMTGASSLSYWGSMYLFDILQYTISILLLICTFVIADCTIGTQFYHDTETGIFFLILFLFGASVLPLVYIFSFWNKSMNASINLLSIMPIILSFIDFLLLALSETFESKIYDAFRAVQSKIFLLFPHISFVYGHVSFFDVVRRNARCRSMPNRLVEIKCGKPDSNDYCCDMECKDGVCKYPDPYFVPNDAFTSLPESLIWMTASVCLYFGIIFILEQNLLFKLFARIRRIPSTEWSTSMDELVIKEANVVSSEVATLTSKSSIEQQQIPSENAFLVDKLSKIYDTSPVVKGISFRVKQGECFGLLGVNGAGKSTTFRMLTGAEIPHSGSVFLKRHSLGSNRKNYLAQMGYCPQQDAIIDKLNAWEHLYLFARLRGIPRMEVQAAVEKWILKLNLTRCAAQPSGTYSGGNKRRLNIAMALIGNPSLVLMDEPTTGVDPAARRSLWNTLKTCQEFGQSIILTSHSMEECEALCNRLVIMVKGQLVCVGASQELKQRFGAGYNIHIKLNPASQSTDVTMIKRRIESTLVCKLSDENAGFVGYHVTDPETTWTIMYTLMNELKNDYPCMEDFAVLSSTLEQLFIQFARAPDDSNGTTSDEESGLRKRRWWQKKSAKGSPQVSET